MEDTVQRISELNDEEVIDSVIYLDGWMKECIKNEKKSASKIQWDLINEQEALEILAEAFPDTAIFLDKMSSTKSLKGLVARNFLLFLSQRERYIPKVEETFDMPILKGELLTIAIAAGILFFLTLEFDLEYEEADGQKRKKIRISRKAIPAEAIENLKKLLGI